MVSLKPYLGCRGSSLFVNRESERVEMKLSYEDMLAQAADIIADEATVAAFKTSLAAGGYDSVADLETLTWEELEAMGLKRPKAKRLATLFRGSPANEEIKPVQVSLKVKNMTRRELLDRYDWDNPESPVGARLSDLAGEQPCIVFNADGTLDVEASLVCMEDIRIGLPARATYVGVDGSVRIVYKVWDSPGKYHDEDPLYSGKPLRSDGSSTVIGRNWSSVPKESRILLNLAIVSGELRITAPQDAHDAMDLAERMSPNGLRARFQRAAARYEELSATGNLPTLKVRVGTTAQQAGSGASNDPFNANGGGHRRY